MRVSLKILAVAALIFFSSQSMARSGEEISGMSKWERWVKSFPDSESLSVRWGGEHQSLISVHGLILPPMNAPSAKARVQELVKHIVELHGIKTGDLDQAQEQGSANRTALRYAQHYEGLPVEDKALVVTVRKDGAVVGIENNLASFSEPSTPMVLKAEEARLRALDALKFPVDKKSVQAPPAAVILEVLGTPVRTWRVPVAALPNGLYSVYVRGDNGKILWVRNRMIR